MLDTNVRRGYRNRWEVEKKQGRFLKEAVMWILYSEREKEGGGP